MRGLLARLAEDSLSTYPEAAGPQQGPFLPRQSHRMRGKEIFHLLVHPPHGCGGQSEGPGAALGPPFQEQVPEAVGHLLPSQEHKQIVGSEVDQLGLELMALAPKMFLKLVFVLKSVDYLVVIC